MENQDELQMTRRDMARAALRLQPRVIAIDGPAGSGKTTVGYAVADQIRFIFFDTGAMYRAVTWTALVRGIDVRDEASVSQLAEAIDIDILPPPDLQSHARASVVLVDGEDVSDAIRRPEVDQTVSIVSAYGGVRSAMSRQQRRVGSRYGRGIAELPGIVMVGRDIGTVIMPDAPLKIYLDASAEERARRRSLEHSSKGKMVDYEQVLEDIRRRDELDSGRTLSPLRVANDAKIIDTSTMTIEVVVAKVFEYLLQVTAAL